MAKTKSRSKSSKKSEAQDADIARKIWLAGVGAYDRMYSETQGAAGKLAKSANETFHQLVAKGEEVEDAVRARIANSPQGEKLGSLMEAWASRAQKLTEEQAAALQKQLGKVSKSVSEAVAPWNVAALGHAIERLSTQVETLSNEVESLKAAKPASASKPVKAAASAKPAAAKPAPKAPAPKAPTAKPV